MGRGREGTLGSHLRYAMQSSVVGNKLYLPLISFSHTFRARKADGKLQGAGHELLTPPVTHPPQDMSPQGLGQQHNAAGKEVLPLHDASHNHLCHHSSSQRSPCETLLQTLSQTQEGGCELEFG